MTTLNFYDLIAYSFAFILCAVGILNIVYIHPVPGISYIMLSMLYLPQANQFFQITFRFMIPAVIKIIVAVILFFFTMGVSDLGDMFF